MTLALLRRVNSAINQLPYGPDPVFDDWKPHDGVPNDCDSYATRKQAELLKAGIPQKDMRLCMVLVEPTVQGNRCHLVLIVTLADADYMLDNRQHFPVPADEIPALQYELLGIQTEGGSELWEECKVQLNGENV